MTVENAHFCDDSMPFTSFLAAANITQRAMEHFCTFAPLSSAMNPSEFQATDTTHTAIRKIAEWECVRVDMEANERAISRARVGSHLLHARACTITFLSAHAD